MSAALSDSHHGAINSRLRVGGSSSLPPLEYLPLRFARCQATRLTAPPAGAKPSSSSLQPATSKSMAAADPWISSPPFFPLREWGRSPAIMGDLLAGGAWRSRGPRIEVGSGCAEPPWPSAGSFRRRRGGLELPFGFFIIKPVVIYKYPHEWIATSDRDPNFCTNPPKTDRNN